LVGIHLLNGLLEERKVRFGVLLEKIREEYRVYDLACEFLQQNRSAEELL
jgi:hypothetical protein